MDLNPESRPVAVVAVAASAGGVEALTRFVKALPADFEAAVLVVLHIPDTGPSVLPGILTRAGSLPAVHAEDGMPLRAGLIIVAPPGRHLRVEPGMAVLDRGPRENGHRPSADLLLRSVARAYGSRSAGVVLSGTMDDGAAGLRAVGLSGGLTMAQDPTEAAFPGMPAAAIAEAHPDLVCSVDAMADRLTSWVAQPPPEEELLLPRVPAIEEGMTDMRELLPFTCPECGGNLWVDDDDGVERYRCRVGHAFSSRGLMVGKQNAVEAALWAAIVALEERADLDRRLLKRQGEHGRPALIRRYRDEIDRVAKQIEVLRGLIGDLIDHGAQTGGSDKDDANPTA
ncbi:MAG: chemotaxis protein CheB [Acidimicrobiaceae bacterium]|nr:chemotaxis protein CheB [Acidimicrobiaceae bacterium]MBO0747846.1 chemotaxis protein CheB [Acidimicrobiaceae bacterium]